MTLHTVYLVCQLWYLDFQVVKKLYKSSVTPVNPVLGVNNRGNLIRLLISVVSSNWQIDLTLHSLSPVPFLAGSIILLTSSQHWALMKSCGVGLCFNSILKIWQNAIRQNNCSAECHNKKNYNWYRRARHCDFLFHFSFSCVTTCIHTYLENPPGCTLLCFPTRHHAVSQSRNAPLYCVCSFVISSRLSDIVTGFPFCYRGTQNQAITVLTWVRRTPKKEKENNT